MTPDQELAALRARYGARWQIWYVPLAVGGTTWCGLRWADQDDRRKVLHADTPGHLAEYMIEAETADHG